jgi:hypothetical protein
MQYRVIAALSVLWVITILGSLIFKATDKGLSALVFLIAIGLLFPLALTNAISSRVVFATEAVFFVVLMLEINQLDLEKYKSSVLFKFGNIALVSMTAFSMVVYLGVYHANHIESNARRASIEKQVKENKKVIVLPRISNPDYSKNVNSIDEMMGRMMREYYRIPKNKKLKLEPAITPGLAENNKVLSKLHKTSGTKKTLIDGMSPKDYLRKQLIADTSLLKGFQVKHDAYTYRFKVKVPKSPSKENSIVFTGLSYFTAEKYSVKVGKNKIDTTNWKYERGNKHKVEYCVWYLSDKDLAQYTGRTLKITVHVKPRGVFFWQK